MKFTKLASAVILATAAPIVSAATYTITPLTDINNQGEDAFSQSIDNSGLALVVVNNKYGLAIDHSLFDFTDNTNVDLLEDADGAEAGNFTDADYLLIRGNMSAFTNPIQVFGEYSSYQLRNNTTAFLPGLDYINDVTNEYTHSGNTIVQDSVDGEIVVGRGTGSTIKISYNTTNSDDEEIEVNTFYREYGDVAIVGVRGDFKPIPSVDNALGGVSRAYAINSNMQVAGRSSVSFQDAIQTSIDNCDDDDTRGDIPLEVCYASIRVSSLSASATQRATVWQLDQQGDVISSQAYDLVFELDEDDNETFFTTTAFGINDQGIAVGRSHTGETDRILFHGQTTGSVIGTYVATIFRDGETIEPLDREGVTLSSFVDINNNNWAVGESYEAPSEISRSRMVLHNVDSEETRIVDGFFTSAEVYPRAINNNDIVVGQTDIETTATGLRERHGFMYDVNGEGTLIDLNTLLSCEAQQAYTIVDAVDVNDNGDIIVDVRVQSNVRDLAGTEVVNDEGETTEYDKVISAVLNPTSGEIESCDDSGNDGETNYERQGASTGIVSIALLFAASVFRRRQK